MKKNLRKLTALLKAMAMLLTAVLTGCSGGSKIEAGDYSGSVHFDHSAEVTVPALGGGESTQQTFDSWGADVTITVDEDGVIWNIAATAPDGDTMSPSAMAWTVYGGKFLSSITGIYTCADIMEITVDTEEDGFPVLTGDCSGIHLADGQEMTLLYDHESACALIILAIQDAITTNNLV
jgi:hypothetical protein